LERIPIVFRGRIVSRRYLSDLRKTNTPASLLVFDHVEVFKGRLAKTSRDRNSSSRRNGAMASAEARTAGIGSRGETVVVGAHRNHFVDPSKAVDVRQQTAHLQGANRCRIGMCRSGRLTPMALELLNAPEDEIVRLKREYLPLRPN
jgi:hypothetical protein